MNELTEKERKKFYHTLRSMIKRYRKAGKTDKVAINSFAYEKGLTKAEVEEMYQIIIDAGRPL